MKEFEQWLEQQREEAQLITNTQRQLARQNNSVANRIDFARAQTRLFVLGEVLGKLKQIENDCK